MAVPASPREGVSFHASPLLICSGIAAVGSSVLLAVLWYVDANSPPPAPAPGGNGPPPPPGSHLTLQILLGLCIVTWLAVLVAVCRDQVVRRINQATQEILDATRDYGEHLYNEGYLKARGASHPNGDVLRFPRPAPPLDPD